MGWAKMRRDGLWWFTGWGGGGEGVCGLSHLRTGVVNYWAHSVRPSGFEPTHHREHADRLTNRIQKTQMHYYNRLREIAGTIKNPTHHGI